MSTTDLTSGSYFVGRRLSGSSNKMSLKDEDMEILDFNINDISRASSPASISARSEGHMHRERRHHHHHRHSFRGGGGSGDDDYRRRYNKLKAELEMERNKVKAMTREKIEEMRHIREYYEDERRQEQAKLLKTFEDDKQREVNKVREELLRQKDYELQQVLKYKEDELRYYRSHTPSTSGSRTPVSEMTKTTAPSTTETPRTPRGRDRGQAHGREVAGERSPSQSPSRQWTSTSEQPLLAHAAGVAGRRDASLPSAALERSHTPGQDGGQRVTSEGEEGLGAKNGALQARVQQLEEEVRRVAEERDRLREEQRGTRDASQRREEELVRVKEEYEQELRRVISEYKSVALGNLKKLRLAEHALREGAIGEDDVLHLSLTTAATTPEVAATRRLFSASQSEAGPEPVRKSSAKQQQQQRRGDKPTQKLQKGDNISNKQNLESGDESKREERERERGLQKRLADLHTQTQRLERKVMLLRNENEALKKKHEDQKPLEEKIKVLKKRNAELASIARRLEDKAKTLQQENAKNRTKARDEGGVVSDGEHLKRMFARQRAKDLAEHAKNMLAKDYELEQLRRKCQELADQLSNGESMAPENVQMYSEKEELVNIVKQAAKERLQLEQQLAHSRDKEKPAQLNEQDREKQRQELEAANEILHKEIEKLEQALQDSEDVKENLHQKSRECEVLRRSIAELKEHNKELEEELHSTSATNTQLAVQLSELEEKVKELETVNEECSTLRVTLAAVQHDREAAKEQVTTLQTRVISLENLVKELQESADRLKHLEVEYKDAVSQLSDKQRQFERLQEAQKESKEQQEKTISGLQAKIRQLEDKSQAQDQRQGELDTEVLALRQHKEDLEKLLVEQKEQYLLLQQKQEVLEKEAAVARTDAAGRRRAGVGEDSTGRRSPAHGHVNDEGVKNVQQTTTDEIVPLTSVSTSALESTPVHETGDADEQSQLLVWLEQRQLCYLEDPELVEIACRLERLLARGGLHECSEEPEDSGMDNRKDTRPYSQLASLSSRLSTLAMQGPIQVYVAKYSYNPFEYSPNENPEAELQLNAGDYVLVHGDMDEDGFFEGELIDGRRGLVPSNFIDRVSEEDLVDFHMAVALAEAGSTDNSSSNSRRGDSSDSGVYHIQTFTTKPPHSPADSDNEDMTDRTSVGVLTGQIKSSILNNNNNNTFEPPHPVHLMLERQLMRSVLISWHPPEGLSAKAIQAYHVYLNGVLKATIKGSERTKALLEEVDANQNHRVSVRCISTQGQSKDAQCTMIIGRDVLPVPSDLKVFDVTQNSGVISWLPGNSNCHHAILLNGHEVHVTKPGVSQHMLTGLDPGTAYRITIATKSAPGEKHKWSQDKVSCNIEFKTLTGGGVPEPPLNVQVESGPREGTLLLTWLPVTINSSGFSNGSVVTGYAVYADGKKIQDATGPTNDHAILSAETFKGTVPKQLTVRTVTMDNQDSLDSSPVKLPPTLIRELTAGTAHTMASEAVRAVNLRKSNKTAMGSGEHVGQETDEEIEAAFLEAENSSPEIDAQIAEPFAESSSSELSDIPEVEEEIGADEPNQNGDSSLAISQCQVEKVQKSPKPAPRKVSPTGQIPTGGTEFTPKRFHGQKPDSSHTSHKDGLLTTPMIVPAIEITRDSSTERGTSFEDDLEGAGSHRSPSPHGAGQKVQQRQKSVEDGIEKPLPAQDPVTQRYRSSPDQPSAFRNVEQGKHRTVNSEATDSVANAAESTKNNKSISSPSKKSPSHSAKDERLSGLGAPPPKPARLSPTDQEDVNDGDSISGEINPTVEESAVRLFIALFDYDPITMSPNVEFIDEELPFREGQILKIYGDKDADGFYRGEVSGRLGYVPCNMISEIHIDDPDLIDQLLKESQTADTQGLALQSDKMVKREEHATPNGLPAVPVSGPVRRMVALYDYDPQELSPNVDSELELAFKQGDIIYIFGDMDEDGFYSGELGNLRGLVPSNFLQDAPEEDEDEALESASMVSPSRSAGSISAASRLSDSATTVNNTQRRDRLSLSPPKERAIVLDTPADSQTPGATSAQGTDEEKPKKKGGLLNKGRSILKKFSR